MECVYHTNDCQRFDCSECELNEENRIKMTKEKQALLQKWKDNRGISIEDFEDAMNVLQEPQKSEDKK